MSLILKWIKDMCKKNVEALGHVCINMCTGAMHISNVSIHTYN